MDFDIICGKVLHKDIDPVTNFCMNKVSILLRRTERGVFKQNDVLYVLLLY